MPVGVAPRVGLDRRSAEEILFAELGAQVTQLLRPHLGALVSIADLDRVNPQIRPFLRHLGELHSRLAVADSAVHRWRTQCGGAEAQLEEARAEVESLKAHLRNERERHSKLDAELRNADHIRVNTDKDRSLAEERLGGEFRQLQEQVMRMGQQGMLQTQALASEQASKAAWAHEINRLRVELEVTGSMSRQQAASLEVARRQAANSDITAEQAGQERIRLEALLRHSTREQHSELVSATESATAEASRMRARVETAHNELQGVRNAKAGMEALWFELRNIAPCFGLAAEFLRDEESPAAQVIRGPQMAAGGLPPVRIPVCALRWRPGAAINTTPLWSSVRTGLYCIFHQLQTGALNPENVELTVCCADGRWFCSRDEDDDKFAALLLYQALHRDTPVACTCRVGTVHALLDIPKGELATAAGLSVRSSGALWRVPPLDEEDFFRAFMRDSPLWEVVEDFLYQRRRTRVDDALQAEAMRNPIESVIRVPGPLAQQPVAQSQMRPTQAVEQARDRYVHEAARYSAMHARARSAI